MRAGFRMTIGAEPGGVARVSAAFARFAETNGLPAPVRRSLHVALDELLHNTVTYGFRDRGSGEVTVEVELRADRVAVTLTDDGVPFDPLGVPVPGPALPVAEQPIGGLGIHLVRRMMDEVSYHRQGDRNVVVLAKHLRGGRSMNITTRARNDVTVVAFAGNLDSNTSPEAQQALDAVLAGGGKKIVVDFSALDYISSAGLRVLLGTAKRLSGVGGALRLFGLNETVREVLEISGFSTILALYPSEDQALDRF
jgi:serine/threonine-protein kinase RsbW